MRLARIKQLLGDMIREQSSEIAVAAVQPAVAEIKRASSPSSGMLAGSLDFTHAAFSTSGYAGKKNPDAGFIWGDDTWGDGTVSYEDAARSPGDTVSGGVDTQYLDSDARGGVVRRF